MQHRFVNLVIVLALLLSFSLPPAVAAPGPASALQAAATVSITVSGFDPAQSNIQPGDPVEWVNQTATSQRIVGGLPNSLYLPLVLRYQSNARSMSQAARHATQSPPWESGEIAPGGRFTHTFTGAGRYPYYLANAKHLTGVVIVAGTAQPDFAIGVAPASQSVTSTTPAQYTVSLTSIHGFSAPVTLAVSSLPTGVTAQWSENPVTPSASAILTLTPSAATPVGAYALSVIGEAEEITHSADFVLVRVDDACRLLTAASFTSDSPAPLGQAMHFTATFSPADATLPLTYTWNFGTGAVNGPATMAHTFAAAGTHTVVLTVANPCGQVVHTAPVTVLEESPSSNNYWPQQLGNYWILSLNAFDETELRNWAANFRGNRTGVSGTITHLNCTEADFDEMLGAAGSRAAWSIYPTSGFNRFVSSRYVTFYKESEVAYHAPKYCNLLDEPSNSWNLQWYMNNPVFDAASNNTWMGSQGGIRILRSATDMVQNNDIAQHGDFPKSTTLYNGSGRYPQTSAHYDAVKEQWVPDSAAQTGLTGYSYLPLSFTPYQTNTLNSVVTDFSYDFGMGYGPTYTNFTWRMNTYLNMSYTGKLTWNMEYLKLQAADILSEQALLSTTIAPTATVFGVVFYEPYYRNRPSLVENDEAACEAYYFIPDVGPVRISHSIVAVLPGDDASLSKTTQFCYYLYRDEINKSQERKGLPPVDFSGLADNMDEIQLNYYHYPVNTMELVAYKVYTDPTADRYGFDSPAASLMDIPQPNSQIYIKNGNYWIYTPDGLLYMEGKIQDAWSSKAPACSINGGDLYPWSNGGPDGLEYGPDFLTNTGRKGIIINDGCYWLHSPGDAAGPFFEHGLVRDYFPEYFAQFGDDTDDLAVSGTGNGQMLLVKDGYYMYYQKVGEAMQLGLHGYLRDLSGWNTSPPTISGVRPLTPDAMMYGPILSQSYNDLPDYAIPAENQLIVFQQGAIWVRYGFSGPWETWNGQLR